MEFSNVLLSQAFPPMYWIRHWRRTWGNLTKYNVGRCLENNLEEEPDGMHKEKAPDIV